MAEPGAFLGEISALLSLPHTATVKTLEPSRFLVVEKPTEFLRSQPEIALSLSRLLAQRLNYVTGYLVDLKTQFEGSQDHLGMVDEILESLVHHLVAGQREPHRLPLLQVEHGLGGTGPALATGVEDPGGADAVHPGAVPVKRRLVNVSGQHHVRRVLMDPAPEVGIAKIFLAAPADR